MFPSLSMWSYFVQLTKDSTSEGHIFDLACVGLKREVFSSVFVVRNR